MLECRNLCLGYHGEAVLQDVSAVFPLGEVTVIIGPNGCGKSTLLKALAGLLFPLAGEVVYDERDIRELAPKEYARMVSYMPQDRETPNIDVFRMVLHGRFPYLQFPRRYRVEDMAKVEAALAKVGIADLRDRPLAELSGGQRQKVYLAMALAQDTPVILMDEPTTWLDIAHQLELLDLIKALAAEGKGVVLVSHDLPRVMDVADRILLLHERRLLFQGSPGELAASNCINESFHVALSSVEIEGRKQYFFQ